MRELHPDGYCVGKEETNSPKLLRKFQKERMEKLQQIARELEALE